MNIDMLKNKILFLNIKIEIYVSFMGHKVFIYLIFDLAKIYNLGEYMRERNEGG